MHKGCPHRCIFCNVYKTLGVYPDKMTEDAMGKTINDHFASLKGPPDRIQIAFYGGNFTGMGQDKQIELLEYTRPFIERKLVDSIRISTRPDCITPECLDMLKAYHVKTIEIGAQSMSDDVLAFAHRGHRACDVTNAMKMLTDWGFETGIHLMAGLPGDTLLSFDNTVEQIIALRPDMVRIHPTIVFSDTELERLYKTGEYMPMGLNEAIDVCKTALRKFTGARIPVIRLGLQTTREMEAPGTIVAGPYHPAFRSLVQESLYFDLASSLLLTKHPQNKTVSFTLSPKAVSDFRGHKNRNLQKLKEQFGMAEIRLISDPCRQRLSVGVAIE